METEQAYQTLKNQLELNEDCDEAYETAIENPDEYLETIKEQVEIAIASVKMGQSMIATGEIARTLYNGTHRELPDGTVVELSGADLLPQVGAVMAEEMAEIQKINQVTEEYGEAMISVNSTVDMSYA